ncbi:hypothetical protein KW785_00860 [Candidatus Parcubacteria bacterium]|nr:hypothetical protein [Candidatus Parcubacteria bacterium]
MIKRTSQAGFSLVEMALYVAILSFMLMIIINILEVMNKSVRRLHAEKSVQSSGVLALERIVRESRDAQSIVVASSTLATSPGVVVLSGVDASSNPRTVIFSLQSGVLHIKENGVDQGALTQSDAKVTSLIFERLTTTHSEALRTQITIESGTSTHYRSEKFYSTTILRGSL